MTDQPDPSPSDPLPPPSSSTPQPTEPAASSAPNAPAGEPQHPAPGPPAILDDAAPDPIPNDAPAPPAWFRPVLAWVMIAVATLGALAAYRAAEVEHKTTQLTLRLTLGRMFEAARWSEYANQYAFKTILEARVAENASFGRQLAARADEIRSHDPKESQQLDLRAEEEFAISRIFGSFNYFMKGLHNGTTPGRSLTMDVTPDLKELGFAENKKPIVAPAATPGKSQADEAPHREAGDEIAAWGPLKGDRDDAHKEVLGLVGGVACFVFALVLFTLADLYLHRIRIAVILEASGIAIATAASIFTAYIDVASRWPIIGICLLVAGFIGLGLRWRAVPEEGEKGEWLYPKEVKWELFRGPHLVLVPHTNERLSRWAIVAIALTVFFSAFVGFLYSNAAINRDRLADEALDEQTSYAEQIAQSHMVATAGVFDGAISRMIRQVRCAAATHRQTTAAVAPEEHTRLAEEKVPCADMNRYDWIVGSLQNMYSFRAEFGPANYLSAELIAAGEDFDIGFSPGRFLYNSVIYGSILQDNPARAYALVDGYQELSAVWNGKVTVYLANLTLFAIALYFFGQALGVPDIRQARNFFAIGILFTVGALGWAGATFMGSGDAAPNRERAEMLNGCEKILNPPAESDRSPIGLVKLAARHYGNGEAHQALAKSLTADAAYYAYDKSAQSFKCALAARPAFARASFLLKKSYLQMASPQPNDDYRSLPTRSKVDDIVAAQENALASFTSKKLIAPDDVQPHGAAFDRILLAFLDTDPFKAKATLRRATRDLEDYLRPNDKDTAGKRRASEDPVLYLNLALALLADDRVSDAEKIYRHVIDDMKVSENRGLMFSTLTDLGIFTRYCANLMTAERCKQLESFVTVLKQKFVNGQWQEKPVGRVALRDIATAISPTSVSWRGRLDFGGSLAAFGKLTVVWYVRDAPSIRPDDNWHVWRVLPDLSKTIDLSELTPDAKGFVGRTVPYPMEDELCLPRGQYRADFYVDGVLIPNPEITPLEATLETYRSRELNVTFCAPKQWHVQTGLEKAEWSADLMRLYSAKIDDQMQNVMVLATFFAPRGVPGSELEETYKNRTLEAMISQQARRPGTFMPTLTILSRCDEPSVPGSFLYRPWVTSEGFVHVAVISPVMAAKDACAVLGSLQNYFPPVALSQAPVANPKP